MLADALGHDVRIGRRFLNAGLGFGGGCLPKDIRALAHRAGELGAGRAAALLQQVDEINMARRQRVIDTVLHVCGGSVLNRRIGILGTAFKPLTDDVRDSPAPTGLRRCTCAARRSKCSTRRRATAQRQLPTLTFGESITEAATGADVMLVLTEFTAMDPVQLAALVASPTVVDARHCLDAERWRAAGWRVCGLSPATDTPATLRATDALTLV